MSNNRGICGIQTTKGYALFSIVCPQKRKEQSFIDHGYKEPFYVDTKNWLYSITLHPESGIFACTGEQREGQLPYFIIRGILPEITEEKHNALIEMWEVAELFKKIIPITERTYVGLMQDGRIASIACVPGNQAQRSFLEVAIKSVTYQKMCCDGKRIVQEVWEDLFDDIAGNMTYTTATGSRPRFAFLNKEGLIFATDFRYGKKPILFRVGQAEKEREEYGLPWHFFYDNDTIGLEYSQPRRILFTWPVNLDITIDVEHNCNRQHSAPLLDLSSDG